MQAGDIVIITHNPHDTRAVDIIGVVRSIRRKAGTGGCDLADVEFQDPLTSSRHILPFAGPSLLPATQQNVQALADALESRAAVLRRHLPILRE
ncbi:MAG TPA: hypothetical protein VLM89_17420 [Phycisphaerae bacterium]|nr:hypothetical protein [Phycisphaerae bacterium]